MNIYRSVAKAGNHSCKTAYEKRIYKKTLENMLVKVSSYAALLVPSNRKPERKEKKEKEKEER